MEWIDAVGEEISGAARHPTHLARRGKRDILMRRPSLASIQDVRRARSSRVRSSLLCKCCGLVDKLSISDESAAGIQ
jgi:hypothetical protein